MKIYVWVTLTIFFLLSPFSTASAIGACIDLQKRVSVDGGDTFFDADSQDEAPEVPAPAEAWYQLILVPTDY